VGRPGVGCAIVFVAGCGFDRGNASIDAPAPPPPDADPNAPDADPTLPDADPTLPDAAPLPDAPPHVCSTAGMVCPGQPPTLLSCGTPTDCWVGCTNGSQVTFSDAIARCDAWRSGARLTPVYTLGELACVRSQLNEGAHMLGLVQAVAGDVHLGWSWNGDGIALLWTHWDGGQPDDAGGGESGTEQCAFSEGGTNGAWHDTPCDAVLSRFSCRYP
jgi:hypothetical protein